MALLLEEQFELDGYVFGGIHGYHRRVTTVGSGIDPGSVGITTQDAALPGRDGSIFGRDTLSAPEWGLTLAVRSDLDVWEELAGLVAQWRPSTNRRPGEMSVLRYRRNGRSYRMYGRPRKIDLKPAARKNDEFQQVEATFQLAEPVQYLETPQQGANIVDLTLLPTDTSGGLVWPALVPFEFRAGSNTRVGGASVVGTAPTPFTVTITGPVTGALSRIRLAGAGWEITSSATVAPGQRLVIDTRAQTIQLDGVNVPGTLGRRSRLNARLSPGVQTLTFAGSDPSNTAKARFEWLDAVPL